LGSFIGFGYAFVAGFLAGFIISRLYNYIVRLSER
jgi:fructose-specific phosphotransferase system IIC component